MKKPEEIPNLPPQQNPVKAIPVFSPQNLVTIYTTLRILQTMRESLGLEAMLEYLGRYLVLVEKDNPQLKFAVTRALKMMSVEKMYRDAVGADEK